MCFLLWRTFYISSAIIFHYNKKEKEPSDQRLFFLSPKSLSAVMMLVLLTNSLIKRHDIFDSYMFFNHHIDIRTQWIDVNI